MDSIYVQSGETRRAASIPSGSLAGGKKKSLDLVAGQAGGQGRGLVSGRGVGRQHLAPLQSPGVGPAREVPELCAVTPERQRTSVRPTGRCGT